MRRRSISLVVALSLLSSLLCFPVTTSTTLFSKSSPRIATSALGSKSPCRHLPLLVEAGLKDTKIQQDKSYISSENLRSLNTQSPVIREAERVFMLCHIPCGGTWYAPCPLSCLAVLLPQASPPNPECNTKVHPRRRIIVAHVPRLPCPFFLPHLPCLLQRHIPSDLSYRFPHLLFRILNQPRICTGRHSKVQGANSWVFQAAESTRNITQLYRMAYTSGGRK
jgi:hypothetical protein